MGGRHTIECNEDGCAEQCNRWRQCPHKECSLDIAYCKSHGDESRAQTEMEKHIEEHA